MTVKPDAPDILSIWASDGKAILRITPENEWVWAEDADPDEAASIFAEAVVRYLPTAALKRLSEVGLTA